MRRERIIALIMEMFYIWDCDHCEHKTPILPLVLPSIKGDPATSPTVEPFVDFVCPQCGYGRRGLVGKIRQEGFRSPPQGAILDPIDLFRESLECDVAGCPAHARVHTQGETSTSGTTPKIAVSEWRGMKGITCSLGHLARVPVVPKSNYFDQIKGADADKVKIS